MTGNGWRNLVLLGVAACGAAEPALAGDPAPSVTAFEEGAAYQEPAVDIVLPPLAELFDRPSRKSRGGGPDWMRRVSAAIFERERSASDDWHVALQRDRTDGAEMLTVRYPLPTLGPLETYAGAGVNRSVYFAESSIEPTLLNNHNRRRALGAAAELGAELRLSDRMLMRADVRWIDLADDANILRDDRALLIADPVALGVSVGWRFP